MRIHEPDAAGSPGDHNVVLLSELPDNRGQSIANAVEQLAGEAIPANALPSAETFDLVAFSARKPRMGRKIRPSRGRSDDEGPYIGSRARRSVAR